MKTRFAALAAMVLLVVCGLFAPAAAQIPPAQAPSQTLAKPDPWAAVRFLIGAWEAKTTGGVVQAQVAAAYTFRLELRDHVLARHSRSGACIAPDDSECRHSDLLYVYFGGNGQTLEAIYFDNEGHVIRYSITTPKTNTVVFLSDASQPGPQYRLTYELTEGILSGKSEFRMPGQSDFTSYLEWNGKRR